MFRPFVACTVAGRLQYCLSKRNACCDDGMCGPYVGVGVDVYKPPAVKLRGPWKEGGLRCLLYDFTSSGREWN